MTKPKNESKRRRNGVVRTSDAPSPDETAIARRDGGGEISTLVESAKRYAAESRSSNTKRAYATQWNIFTTWCAARNRAAVPAAPDTITLYITDRADGDAKPATIALALSAIRQAHRLAGAADPTQHPLVTETWRGIKRVRGLRQTRKAPLMPKQLRAIAKATATGLAGIRDRAILLLGFAGAFRRSEICALDFEDLAFDEERGLVITLRKSKTDQEGRGDSVAIPFAKTQAVCPVLNLARWLKHAGIDRGPVFRRVTRWGAIGEVALTDQTVARIVKQAVRSIGLDRRDFSGHSLRAGLATAAASAGKPTHEIKQQGRWKNTATLDRYVRPAQAFDRNAAEGLL